MAVTLANAAAPARTFETVVALETTSETSANAGMGDLDGDLDVLTSNDTPDRKLVYRNDGKGRFALAGSWAVPEWETRNAAPADLNGDGRLDVVAATRPGPSFACLGEGDGRFASPCIAVPAESATTIVAADFEEDGFVDLAVPSRDGGQSRVYFNDGKAGLARTTPFGPPDAAARVAAAADFDRDDRPDVVLGYTKGPHSVFFNHGSGRFVERVFGDAKGAAYGIALGDVNADGFPDIALARSGAPNVLYLNGR